MGAGRLHDSHTTHRCRLGKDPGARYSAGMPGQEAPQHRSSSTARCGSLDNSGKSSELTAPAAVRLIPTEQMMLSLLRQTGGRQAGDKQAATSGWMGRRAGRWAVW